MFNHSERCASDTHSLCKHCWIALLQHLLELLVCRGFTSCQEKASELVQQKIRWQRSSQLTDLQLTLYSCFTSFSIIGLRPIVFCHNFNKLSWQRRVLCLTYSQIGGRWLCLLLLLDALFDTLMDTKRRWFNGAKDLNLFYNNKPWVSLWLYWHFS